MRLKKFIALPVRIHRILLRSRILLWNKILLRSRTLRKVCRTSTVGSNKKPGIGALYFIESMRDVDYYGKNMLQPIIMLLIGLSNTVILYVVCIDNIDFTIKHSKDCLIIKQLEKTVKLSKEDAYDIMKQMDLEKRSLLGDLMRIKIGKSELDVRSSTIELNHDQYQIVKKHFVGRLMNIHEWPRQAVELWATYCLKLNRELLYDALKEHNKKELVKLSQKYFTYTRARQEQNKTDIDSLSELLNDSLEHRGTIYHPEPNFVNVATIDSHSATADVGSGSQNVFMGENAGEDDDVPF